jgi:hypothetical protein
METAGCHPRFFEEHADRQIVAETQGSKAGVGSGGC